MLNSSLFDQDNFYKEFIKDLYNAQKIVIIESPFITQKRMNQLLPIFRKLISRGVRIIVNTKPFDEHNQLIYDQVIWAVGEMQAIGIEVFMTVGHHRKLAVIDDDILWEGSLNILSQNDSCELMRRIHDKSLIAETLNFINFKKWAR